MTSLSDNFKIAGVTSARDKILALCNAPALFFDYGPGGEDHCMVHQVSFVVGSILAEDIAKHDIPFQQHIKEGLLNCPIDDRRNLVYGLADPAFLDTYIGGLISAYNKLKVIREENEKRINDLLLEETGVPMFKTMKEYREYHARKVSIDS